MYHYKGLYLNCPFHNNTRITSYLLCTPYNVIFTPVNMIKLLALCTVQRYIYTHKYDKSYLLCAPYNVTLCLGDVERAPVEGARDKGYIALTLR